MTLADFIFRSLAIGVTATALLDLWALLMNRLTGAALPNWAMVGRWVGHLPKGVFSHDDIGKAAPVSSERAIGWAFHYAVGVAFAAATLLIGGAVWAKNPTMLLPLMVGIITVGFGWFVLQPGLGNGVAASRKPDANSIRIRNVVSHIVFGLGMWLAALAIA